MFGYTLKQLQRILTGLKVDDVLLKRKSINKLMVKGVRCPDPNLKIEGIICPIST